MIVDSHCHLDFEGMEEHLPDILKRAAEAGVDRMVSISSRVRRFDNLLRIANENTNVFCTVGTHPHNAHEELDVTSDDLVHLAEANAKCIGIGEVGLDVADGVELPVEDVEALGGEDRVDGPVLPGRVLVVLDRTDLVSMKSVRNLADVHVLAVDQLNTYDVLVSDDVIFTQGALAAFVAGPTTGKGAKAVATEAEANSESVATGST